MKGLPRRPRRLSSLADHAVAEKQEYLAVPYEDEKGISERGEIEPAISISSLDTKFF